LIVNDNRRLCGATTARDNAVIRVYDETGNVIETQSTLASSMSGEVFTRTTRFLSVRNCLGAIPLSKYRIIRHDFRHS
jgi:hypothetical protein